MFPQFDDPQPLDDGRAWIARFESHDQRTDDAYYWIRIVEGAGNVGRVASKFIGKVSYLGPDYPEDKTRASIQSQLARIAASGQTNTDYTGSPYANQ